jgi:hypothetical protein
MKKRANGTLEVQDEKEYNMERITITKGSAEEIDCRVSWGESLFYDTDAITASVWVVPSDTVDNVSNTKISLSDTVIPDFSATSPSPVFGLGGTSFTANTAKIFIKGGSAGRAYVMENRVTTQAGRKLVKRVLVRVIV